MNEVILPIGTVITLKEITDLISVRHNDSMKKVAKLSLEDGFGTLREFRTVYNSKGQTIETYVFTKKQAIAVGARLNNTLLMKVINRLEELEATKHTPQSEIELIIASAKALQAQEARLSDVEAKVEVLSTHLDGEIPPEVGYYNINSIYAKGKLSKSMVKRVIDKFKLRSIKARKRVDTGQFQSYPTYKWSDFKKAQKKVIKNSKQVSTKQFTCDKFFGGQKFEIK